MKTYRMNAVMAGVLYFFGTVFGIASAVVGGKVISSLVSSKPLSGANLLNLVVADSSRLLGGSFFILLMGISLVAMTIFLYPIFKKDSEELAMGMLLFRGALEGVWYVMTMINFLVLYALGKEYTATGSDSAALESIANVAYRLQDLLAAVGPMLFLIGATFLYVSFYRTRLIPRWLSIWGLVAVVPYMAYALLHYFQMDNGIGFYLQMLLALQEMVMAFWLIFRGFNHEAIARLTKNELNA